MNLDIYQIDAFAKGVFTGNPAAVVPLDAWLPDATLGQIAAENNLSETAFVVKEGSEWDLRWFTPTMEVALCGHATLGAAHAIFEFLDPEAVEIRFRTRQSGVLTVSKRATGYAVDFPIIDVQAGRCGAESGHGRADQARITGRNLHRGCRPGRS